MSKIKTSFVSILALLVLATAGFGWEFTGGGVSPADLALKAPLASPALTGTPTAPTAAANTNTTQIATTAFAKGEDAAIANPKAFSQAIALTAAASGSSGIAVANDAKFNTTTNNFGIFKRVALPDYTPAAAVIIAQKHDGTNGYIFSVLTTGYLRLTINSTNYDSTVTLASVGILDLSSVNLGVSVTRSSASAAGSIGFYINHRPLGASVTITAGVPVTVSNTAAFYSMGTSAARTAGVDYSTYVLNFAPSATEVLSMQNGIPESWKWGSQTAVYTSDFSAGVDGWSAARGTVAGNVDSVGGEDDWLQCYADATASTSHYAARNLGLVVGKTYEITGKYFIPNSGGSTYLSGLRFNTDGASTTNTLSVTSVGSLATFRFEVVAVSANLDIFLMKGGAVTFTGANSATDDLAYLKDIIAIPIGVTLALEPEGIQPAPGQWLDSSTNKLHAVQPAAGSSLVRRKKDFEVRWTNTWAGTHEAQYIGGVNQNILPPGNIRIDSITGVVDAGLNGVNVIIGDGSDTDRFVESVAMATGVQDFTVANRSHGLTNMKLVIDPASNVTGSIALTIRGTILQ